MIINAEKLSNDSENLCAYQSFGDFLFKSKNNVFTLDLSNSSLIEVIQSMIEVKSKLYPTYHKHFWTTFKYLKMLEDVYKCNIYPHQINDIFWCYFIPFLQEKGLSLSTIRHTCISIKTAIAWSAMYGARISPSYNLLKIPDFRNQQIALTPDEVSRIYHFDLSTINRRPQHLRRFDRVRDMFVLSCNLGQRYSDMIRINADCFDESNIFRIRQKKTNNLARVEINRMAIDKKTVYEILKKYNYNAPTNVDLSGFAKTLKELMRYIGFTEEVRRETKIGGLIKTELIPKWKLICSHTARRTFITVNILRGYNIMEIRRASGHASQSTFERYLCYND